MATTLRLLLSIISFVYKNGVRPGVVDDDVSVLELIAECCNEVIGNINEGVVDDIEDVGVRKEPLLLLKLPIGKKA